MKRESLSAKLESIAAVAGEDGSAVQRVWYFASGLPVTENAAASAVNSRFHIGKEFTGFDGLWWYDNEARQYDSLTMRFTTLDPLAANYPSLSPYAYCANNPVNYIDPDGRDWYKNASGSILWKNQTGEIDGYKNIGTEYEETGFDGAVYKYVQDKLESITYVALDDSDFEKQTGRTDCKKTADRMVRKSGGIPSVGREGEILMTHHDANGVATTPTADAQKGIERLSENIMDGKAVTVGVDYKDKQIHNKAPYGDGMTDHFVTVMSMTEHLQGKNVSHITFRFFDPGSSSGNSDSNFFNLKDNKLEKQINKKKIYTVTTIRSVK